MLSKTCLCIVISLCAVLVIAAPVHAAMDWSSAEPLYAFAATDTDSDYYTHWAHDGNGNWVCAWCAAIPASTDRDFDILVSLSSDGGATWTDPAILDPFADSPPEIEDDFHPNVYTDGAGHWIAVWYSHDNHGGTIGDDTDILVSRSTDNGQTWTSSVPLNTDAGADAVGDSTPDLVYAGGSTWIAVTYRMSAPDTGDYDVYTSRSTDHGATWTPLVQLHSSMATDTGYDGGPRIATDGAGHFIVVWNSDDPLDGSVETDQDIFFSTSTDSINWSAPAALNSDAAVPGSLDDKLPRILYDGVGRWLVVWYYGVYEIDYDIKFSYSDDNGASWSPVQYLNTNALTDTGRDLYPVPATDGNGNWVVVWQSKEPLLPPIGVDYDIFYAYSTDNAVTWAPPSWLNSNAPDLFDTQYDRDPEILYAGGGIWRTVWGSNYDFGGSIGTDYDLMISSARLPIIPGDVDLDGDVDLSDFATFATCYYGSGVTVPPPGCDAAQFDACDFDADSDVDLSDFATFATNFTG
jgi:hypothetical protein